ncbi:armadillo repeat-containing protein 6 [Electrophorus electricus]|uniref:Armadillo repeat containing 6 n=1 Tax=Electrophorus electricus TaxID=8005 RepID=A0A4W4GBK3_ELEEL|nr:armadillo repeat-containing protein 6 [Electrophorus electricus]XP_026877546.2 armadillo repeat-containing protein 6 [Electrophorus electricus]XP_026877547.2 armadillo repeat-containing protein 6 [Electrophorus electricus]
MAKRRITQDTFDAVVRENIEEFDMDDGEALREAIEQFESQGVDLSNIVKAVPKASSEETTDEQTHKVLQALESLRGELGSSLASLGEGLKLFTEQCSLGFAQRYLAAQKDAYPTILSCCQRAGVNKEALSAALAAMSMLTDGQPDLLDAEGRGFLIGTLRTHLEDPDLTCQAVRAVRHGCLKHEQNRQDLVKAGALALLTGAVARHALRPDVVKEACATLRVMTFDDDVRVPFGHAHEHAKMIVLEHNGLKIIIDAAKAHPGNLSVLSELCATLSRLAVRNEFCQDIVDLGGLKFMMTLLADSLDCQDLVKQVLSALRAIAGNDDVKDAIVSAGGTELIVMAINRHMGNAQVCEQGCAALCVLALRKPNNCKVIMESGGAMSALQAMKAHQAEVSVQKQSCMLLRNLVARTRDFSQPILDMGAEALIGQALATHRDCGDVARAALRDLGCQVELRELWTGKKGSLTH